MQQSLMCLHLVHPWLLKSNQRHGPIATLVGNCSASTSDADFGVDAKIYTPVIYNVLGN